MTRLQKGLSISGLLVAFVVVFSWKPLSQLYSVIRLFHADVIVENFSSISTLIDTSTIKRAGEVNGFNQREQPLPDSFQYMGKQVPTGDWLQQSSTTALVVVHGDDITYEQYFQGTEATDKRISWSVAKSFLSALFGIAIEEGKIKDLNALVTDYVPELKSTGYDGVTIKNVLQMASGVHFNEDYGDFHSDINRFGRVLALGGSFDEFAASLSSGRKPGEVMHYVSIDTHVIGMVLRAAIGMPIEDYFYEKLWSKLGAEQDAVYVIDSEGQPMVLGGLNIITRDYARFGQLFRDYGQHNGEQIVPKQWTVDSVRPLDDFVQPKRLDNGTEKVGYGYQWWVPYNSDSEFMAIGIYGQYIYVHRKKDVVIVKNSADRDFMVNDNESLRVAIAAFRAIAHSI